MFIFRIKNDFENDQSETAYTKTDRQTNLVIYTKNALFSKIFFEEYLIKHVQMNGRFCFAKTHPFEYFFAYFPGNASRHVRANRDGV